MKRAVILFVLVSLLGCKKEREPSLVGSWSDPDGRIRISIGDGLILDRFILDGSVYRSDPWNEFKRDTVPQALTSWISIYVPRDPALYLQKYEVHIYFNPGDPDVALVNVKSLVNSGGFIVKFPIRNFSINRINNF